MPMTSQQASRAWPTRHGQCLARTAGHRTTQISRPRSVVTSTHQGRGRTSGSTLHGLQDGGGPIPAPPRPGGFAFDQAQVDDAQVRQLQELRFIDSAHNLVFVGGPGTGKTHLVTMLEAEKAQGKTVQMAHRLMYVDLEILDEMGYLPFSQAGGALLFYLLANLYERTSVVVATNLLFSE
jgi:DNA replication protein DnaC